MHRTNRSVKPSVSAFGVVVRDEGHAGGEQVEPGNQSGSREMQQAETEATRRSGTGSHRRRLTAADRYKMRE